MITRENETKRSKLKRLGSAERLSKDELICALLEGKKKNKTIERTAQEIRIALDEALSSQKIETGAVDLSSLSVDRMKLRTKASRDRADLVLAAIELGRRLVTGEEEKVLRPTPKEVWQSLPEIRNAEREHFIAIMLDSRGKEVGRNVVSIGTVGASLVHPREVFRKAVELNAVSIIGVHNHPSNEADPSSADVFITERLIRAGLVVDIEFEDHIIVTKDSYYSFKEEMGDLFE